MKTGIQLFGIPLSQLISFGTFIIGVVSIWIHLEIRIAEVNVEIANLKQDMNQHKSDNRREFDMLHDDMNTNTREIVGKIDEIQIYLRNRRE